LETGREDAGGGCGVRRVDPHRKVPVSWATSIETKESPSERRDDAGKEGSLLASH